MSARIDAATGGPVSSGASHLDEAFERMAAAGFERPNGFVNHGAMACEALAELGFDQELDDWARRFSRIAGPAVEGRAEATFDWQGSLGDYRRLPEWIGYFERAIAADGWPAVVGLWVPRLMPALSTKLFHGAIRAGHAVRAIESADTAARREELARALGYWAARFSQGEPVGDEPEVDDPSSGVLTAAASAAAHYLASPGIVHLHGVTGAMAVDLLARHLSPENQRSALAQLEAEHAALYDGVQPVSKVRVVGVPADELARSAEHSHDPHQVKLVEAALRGARITAEPAFYAAAETVTGLGTVSAQ